MVRPAAVRLFQEWGIAVHQVFPRAYAERDGDAMEIDLLVFNSTEAILIEVNSELKSAPDGWLALLQSCICQG